jgi:chitodextrinase
MCVRKLVPSVLFALGAFAGMLPSSASAVPVNVTLTETSEAFKNPMKGFRPSRYLHDADFIDHEYTSTYKHYIAYTSLELNASDTAQKIKDWSNTTWAGIENDNSKVIPRVVIYYPGTDEPGYWANGIPHGSGDVADWTNATLKNRLVAMIAKLGQAWDNDPRVAAVELGLWGKWGEHNIYPTQLPGGNDRIPADFQTAMGDAANLAFPNKKWMIRYAETFPSHTMGFIWDSFALPDDATNGNNMISRNLWPTQMISGEVAYDWGNQSQLGGSPDGTLSSNSNTDYVISWIQSTHTSSLGWIAEYNPATANVEPNATRMQKALGYRYVVTAATFPSNVAAGGAMAVSFTVKNVGNAPFYYNWPVKANLLRADHSIACTGTFNVDLRTWLPGNQYTVSGSFTIPSNLTAGTYTLALTINDPAGDLPSLRFANGNYYTGGFTPVGKVGVGQEASDQNLGSFAGLKADNTLHYSLTTAPTLPAAPGNLSATGGNAQVSLSWSGSSGATSYNVLRSTTSGSGYAQIGTSAGTTFTNTGLSNGTAYYFVVRAVNSTGVSGNSNQASATPSAGATIPVAPANLIATAGNAQVSLSWSSSSGATSYYVLRSTTSGSGYAQIGTPAGTSFTNTGLTNGTAYYFVVRAVNPAGVSGNSNQASATPSGGTGGSSYEAESSANTLAGGAVSAVCATASGGYKVGYVGNNTGTLTFNGVSVASAGSYAITIAYLNGDTVARSVQISANNGAVTTVSLPVTGSWTTVGTVAANLILNAGNNTIKFANASGWAPDFDKITIGSGSGSGDTSPPTVPNGLSSPSKTSTSVSLTWNAATDNVGVTGYEIFRNGTKVGTSSSTSYTDAGLGANTAYVYQVDAYDAVTNKSALGSSITVTTSAGSSGTSYEAEASANTLSGGALVQGCAACSGLSVVGYIGNNSGTLIINNVNVSTAGTHPVTIAYTNGDTVSRSVQISANGGTATTVSLGATGSWTTVSTSTVNLTLNAGNNTIKLANPSGWAPDIDKITVN